MNARELELTLALQAIEVRLLAALDARLSALWAVLPSPPVGEIDAVQERGELAKADGAINPGTSKGVRSSDTFPATYDELGLSRQRVSEWRELRDAGDEAHHHG